MIVLYRMLVGFIYYALYPYARFKEARGELIWANRLGHGFPENKTVWLHASSVGEVRVMSYLADYLSRKKPDLSLHLTTMTKAGLKTAHDLLGNGITRSHFPFDATAPVRRALDSIQPTIIVIAETEIWPVMVQEASRRSIMMVQVNGTISDGSLKRYLLIKNAMTKLLNKYHHLFVRTKIDGERFKQLGAQNIKITISGDMKFDAPLKERSAGRISELRHRFGFGADDFVWVAGSTRAGEEKQLLEIYQSLIEKHANLRLVLVPRHLERIPKLEEMLKEKRVPYWLYDNEGLSNTISEESKNAPVLLVNLMGILGDLYLISDLSFVGGTLVNIGGHNLLEPVWSGVPVIFGSYVQNVIEAADYIDAKNFGRRCASVEEITNSVADVISGSMTFERKTENDISHSATASAGDYILRQLQND